jgi:uncharacterized protein (DUF433 family)
VVEGRRWIDEDAVVPVVLDRPLYSVGEAARLLELPGQTLKRWLVGVVVSGTRYDPVIRLKQREDDAVTWAQFVEAGLLRENRGRLSLQYLRTFIAYLRETFDVPYPLAHYRPVVDLSRRKLLLPSGQDGSGGRRLLDPVTMQQLWERAATAYLKKVEFDPEGIASSLRPLGGESPVTIDPEVSFGIPQVKGIRTETIHEAFATGESIEAIARSWNLPTPDVESALQWEARLARAA